MAYKCLDCGEIFDGDEVETFEERHGFDDGRYESFSVCPHCGGAFEEAKRCKLCDSQGLDSELCYGYCFDCVRRMITYDRFVEYFVEINNGDFELFMFDACFGTNPPDSSSERLVRHLRGLFESRKAADLICGDGAFLESCRDFLMQDPDDFVCWLKKRKEVE